MRDTVIRHETVIGRDAVVDRAILDEKVVVAEGCHIGYGTVYRATGQRVTSSGLTLISQSTRIPAGVTIGRNLVV